jgi:hypothetical protein
MILRFMICSSRSAEPLSGGDTLADPQLQTLNSILYPQDTEECEIFL